MMARGFACLAVAVLGAVLQSIAAARPATAEQQRKEEEEEDGDTEAPTAPPAEPQHQAIATPTLELYHITTDGAKTCDFGITATETKCKEIGKGILTDLKLTPGRDYLVSGKFPDAPPGCSLHTSHDFAVTYNSNTEGVNDGSFAEICHGKKEAVHGVKEGESECDFGEPVKWDKCLAAVNSVLHTIAGETQTEQTTVNTGSWNTLPSGCSMHVGAGSEASRQSGAGVAYYNTKVEGKNDGSYLLVCTGTIVPVR